jgi:hypothetical protein
MTLRCRGSITIYPRTGLQKCKNVKDQNTTPKTAPFSCYCSSSSRLKRTPTAAHTVTPAINTIYGLKKRLCSLAIKARDSPCTPEENGGKTEGITGGVEQRKTGGRTRGDCRKKKKEIEEQTCIPLFLLKETEEAKEKKARTEGKNREKTESKRQTKTGGLGTNRRRGKTNNTGRLKSRREQRLKQKLKKKASATEEEGLKIKDEQHKETKKT